MQSDHILLSNGIRWPLIGFGTWKIPDGDEVSLAVLEALRIGYRSIDTAKLYGNELGIGAALKESAVPREELFIATKLWNSDQGFDETLRAFDESQKKLGLDYIDAYLIHWPMPKVDRYLDSWRALERLYIEGRVNVIGVSNFEISHLERIINNADIPPMINQVECHLGLQQKEMLAFCQQHEIVMQGWRSLGNGAFNAHESLIKLAQKYKRTPVQIMIRYFIQQGVSVIPKTVSSSRMLENISVFNFVLTGEEIALLEALDGSCARFGFDPNTYNDQTYSR